MGLPEQLTAVAKSMGCRYTLKGESIPYEQVFAPNGLLPPILRRADQLCSFCLGYGLGLTFERVEGAKTGVVVQMDTTTPNILRLVCAADVLNEFMQHSPSHEVVSLDDLMTD